VNLGLANCYQAVDIAIALKGGQVSQKRFLFPNCLNPLLVADQIEENEVIGGEL